MIVIKSKATHINPLTGFEASDETYYCFDSSITEDADNYYVSPAWSTDNMSTRTFPKSEWILVP